MLKKKRKSGKSLKAKKQVINCDINQSANSSKDMPLQLQAVAVSQEMKIDPQIVDIGAHIQSLAQRSSSAESRSTFGIREQFFTEPAERVIYESVESYQSLEEDIRENEQSDDDTIRRSYGSENIESSRGELDMGSEENFDEADIDTTQEECCDEVDDTHDSRGFILNAISDRRHK